MDNKQLKRRSKQGALISLVGLVIIIAVFGFAAQELNDLHNDIDVKTSELDSLNTEVTNKQVVIHDLIEEINKLKDSTIIPHAKAVKLEGIKDPKGRQIYDFTLWITSSNYTLNTIKSVHYNFGHASFLMAERDATDRSNGFLVSYRGWGCLSFVDIIVEFNNGEKKEVYFDMCEGVSF